MRCPECGKMVSYADEPEVEEQTYEIDEETGDCTAEVEVKLVCAECSIELKSWYLECAVALPDHACNLTDVIERMQKRGSKDEEISKGSVQEEVANRTYTDPELDVQPHVEMVAEGKSGRKLKTPITQYGASIEFTAMCSACGQALRTQYTETQEAVLFDEVA